MMMSRLHKEQEFKQSSPKPAALFDDVRGACSQINSYNNYQQFMAGNEEKSRLKVLQNFKDINRIMTSNFLKNKELQKKYNSRIPKDVQKANEADNLATSTMTDIMKKMQSPRNFTSPLKKFGSVANYQNVSLARNLMKQKETSAPGLRKTKMSSIMNNYSTNFDQLYQSTQEGTLHSQKAGYDRLSDIDAFEQRHNNMNLTLGKPT